MRHCFLALQVVISRSQSVEVSFWPAVNLFISFIKQQAHRMLTCISVWPKTQTHRDCQITLTLDVTLKVEKVKSLQVSEF